MKKILLSLVAFFALALTASAEQKACDLSKLPASSENTTWDAATSTFAWTTTWYNSTEVFGGNDYSYYDTFNYDVEAGSIDHFRIIVRFTNGAAQVTFNPAQAGQKSLTWAQMGVDAADLKFVESIRISGASDGTGDIKINSIYLEGTGAPKPTYEVPEGSTNVKALTGTNANWASSVVYPKEFAVQGQVFGDGDGSNQATWVDVTGFETMTFQVTNSSTGLSLRVWMWDDVNNKVVTLYPYPEADVETADFTAPYFIKTPGKYVVKFGDLTKLKGVKAGNDYGASALQVGIAYVTPPAAGPEPKEYTVSAEIDYNAGQHVKTFSDQKVKVVFNYTSETEGTLDVTLPAASVGPCTMDEQTIKGIKFEIVSEILYMDFDDLEGSQILTVKYDEAPYAVTLVDTEGMIAANNLSLLIAARESKFGNLMIVNYTGTDIEIPTAVKNAKAANAENKVAKLVKNGKVVIVKDGKAYTAAGAAVK